MYQKLKQQYVSAPLQAKAAFWFTVCQAIQSGSKFLALPFLVRLLTTEQYGIYSVFSSWMALISIFATLNLNGGVFNNAMFRYPDRRDTYIASSQSLSMTASLICMAVYLSFSGLWNRLFGMGLDLMIPMLIQILFTESFLLWSARQRYEYHYVRLLIYTAVFAVITLSFPILAANAVRQEDRLHAVVYSGVFAQGIFGLAFMVYNYAKGRAFFHPAFWKYALSFNLPLIPHYLSGIVLGQADRVMIQRYIGEAQAGIYGFTYNISLVLNVVTTAVNNAIVPYTYSKLKKREYRQLRRVANFLLFMIGGLTLLFSAVAPELIHLLATEDYYDAIYLVPVISLSSYFIFVYNLFGNVEFFFEEKKFITAASVTGAAANVMLNALLIPVFGYFAAGYTTLFCYTLFAVAHYCFMRVVCNRHLNGEKVYNGPAILLISVLFVAGAFGMMAIYDFPLIRYFFLLAVLAACMIKRKAIMGQLQMIREK